MITLTDGITNIELPRDIPWIDEHGYQGVVQSIGYSVTGALIIETGLKQAGRPITLQSPGDQSVIDNATRQVLVGWASVPGKVLTLTIRGIECSVVFRHQDGGLECRPLGNWCDDDDPNAILYFLTLQLMVI